ncbi:MAG: hypothetical protein ABIP85_26340, partial [Chthoniobacteraceae bacterium]
MPAPVGAPRQQTSPHPLPHDREHSKIPRAVFACMHGADESSALRHPLQREDLFCKRHATFRIY